MSPTQRTLAYLRGLGMTCGVVERFNPYAKVTLDLFGIIDIIALDDQGVIGVQSCGEGFSDHITKLTTIRRDACLKWLAVPTRKLWLIGWRPLKLKRGGVRMVYEMRKREWELKDFEE